MRILISYGDAMVEVEADGDYAPDCMHDLKNRAEELWGTCFSLVVVEVGDADVEETAVE
jgi:hypothetical protein